MLSHNLKRFKLVTFDVTETLLKFRKPPVIQYKETAEKFGINSIDERKSFEVVKKCFKEMSKKYPNFGCNTDIDWREWWRQLVVNLLTAASSKKLNPQTLDNIALTLIDQYETMICWEKYNKADELVKKIKDAGKCVGVISNYDPRLHLLLKNMSLTDFDFVLTSYEVGVMKPDKRIFDQALTEAKMVVKPAEALHIGNKYEEDCKGAMDADWSGVLIKTGHDDSAIKEQAGCCVYSSLEEFLETLETKEINW